MLCARSFSRASSIPKSKFWTLRFKFGENMDLRIILMVVFLLCAQSVSWLYGTFSYIAGNLSTYNADFC